MKKFDFYLRTFVFDDDIFVLFSPPSGRSQLKHVIYIKNISRFQQGSFPIQDTVGRSEEKHHYKKAFLDSILILHAAVVLDVYKVGNIFLMVNDNEPTAFRGFTLIYVNKCLF